MRFFFVRIGFLFIPIFFWHFSIVLGLVADRPFSVLHIVERPVAARDAEDDLEFDTGVDQGLFEDAYAVAVAQVMRVFGLVAVEVEIADADADHFHLVLVGIRMS